MKVTLLNHSPEPDKIIAAAARLCYTAKDIDELLEGLTEEKVDAFIDKLISLGHESPLEHITFTFGIEGISRACSHQLVRHRMASYSQKSQRYVDETGFQYIVPQSIIDKDMTDEYNYLMYHIEEVYKDLKLYSYQADDGKWGFVDKTGEEVIPLIYDDAWSFNEGLARVQKDDKWGFVDSNSSVVVDYKYEKVTEFNQYGFKWSSA